MSLFRPAFSRALTASLRPASSSLISKTSVRAFSASVASREFARVAKPAPTWKAQAVINKEFKDISLADYKGKWCLPFDLLYAWINPLTHRSLILNIIVGLSFSSILLISHLCKGIPPAPLQTKFHGLTVRYSCPTEIIAFSERSEEFRQLNAEVIGASVDSVHSHLAWINTPRREGGLGDMKIPLISDITKSISRDYGVLLEESGFALRGTFIIDPNGVVRQLSINDAPIGRSVEETLRLLEGLQFADEHGQVCPAGWKKGGKTMNPDPVKSKEYFRNEFATGN
ncbi:peroxiredoxin [Spizellomyces sp. 'palustris']|nr:peroxiredoxin [Spizellomyces sp. 'palustris']